MLSESWMLTNILNIFNNVRTGQTKDPVSEKLAIVKKIEDEIYLSDGFYLIPVLHQNSQSLLKGSGEIEKLRNDTEIRIKLYSFKLVKTELKDHQVYLQMSDWMSTQKHKRISTKNLGYINTQPVVQQCIRKFISNNEPPEKAHSASNSENLSLLLNEVNQEYSLLFSDKDSSLSKDSIISIYSLLPASGMDLGPEKSRDKESSKKKNIPINHRKPDENRQCLCLSAKSKSRKKKFWAIPEDQMKVLDAIPEWKSTYEPSPESSVTVSQEIKQQVSLNAMLSYISSGSKDGFIERNKSS